MTLRHTERDTLARSFGLTFRVPTLVPPATLDWHQFVIARDRPIVVQSGLTTWILCPTQGLWVPGGHTCQFLNRAETSVRMLYFPAHGCPDLSFGPTEINLLNVSPLLIQAVERVVEYGALLRSNSRHQNLSNLIWDELADAKIVPESLLHPSSAELTSFVGRLEQEEFRLDAFTDVVRASGRSRRSIERDFHSETGLSAGEWIRKRRLIQAIDLLTTGETVENVAFRLGYSSPSAFIAMFKRSLGHPPMAFLTHVLSRIE